MGKLHGIAPCMKRVYDFYDFLFIFKKSPPKLNQSQVVLLLNPAAAFHNLQVNMV